MNSFVSFIFKTTKKSESGSEKLLLKSMVKSKSFSMQATSLLELEDLSVTLSMISFDPEVSDLKVEANKPESDEEPQKLVKPDFRLGSITTYGNNSLGPLAALSNYNLEKEHSSFSEQAWDSYQEKYNSEAYSETADADGARRLLDFGDDYRNFLDSQSDNCSSAANIDSMSPPRNRKNFASPSTVDSSLEIASEGNLTKHFVLESFKLSQCFVLERLPSNSEVRRRSLHSSKSIIREPSSSSSSDYSSDIEYDNKIMKILTESKINLEKTEALRGASEQHLKPDDYVRFDTDYYWKWKSSNIKHSNKKYLMMTPPSSTTVRGFWSYFVFVFCFILFTIFITFIISYYGNIT